MSRSTNEPLGNDTLVGIVSQGDQGKKIFVVMAWAVAGFAVLATTIALAKPLFFPPTLLQRAVRIVPLPSDVTVKRIVEGTQETEGEVWFTVPEPKGPGSREKEIWLHAGLAAPFSPSVPSKIAKMPLPGRASAHRVSTPGRPSRPVGAVAHTLYTTYVEGNTYSIRYGSQDETSLSLDSASGWYHYKRTMPALP
jgi:hypothetical protein